MPEKKRKKAAINTPLKKDEKDRLKSPRITSFLLKMQKKSRRISWARYIMFPVLVTCVCGNPHPILTFTEILARLLSKS